MIRFVAKFSGPFVLAMAFLSCGIYASAQQDNGCLEFMYSGKLSEGSRILSEQLSANSENDQLRFELGFVQFLGAVEMLGQDLYKYGSKDSPFFQIPFLRLPVPENPNPQAVSYQDMRNTLDNFLKAVKKSEATLAGIKSGEVKLTVDLHKVGFDFNGDGKVSLGPLLRPVRPGELDLGNGTVGTPAESLDELLNVYMRLYDNDEVLIVDFDRSDAFWLQGYCNLISAMAEAVLAVDMQDAWDVFAHNIFRKPTIKFPFLAENKDDLNWYANVMDAIAAIHQLNFPVAESQRLKNSHGHLKKMIDLSRANWKSILAESDDQREFLPGPNQKSFMKGFEVRQAMVASWNQFLDEWEMLLDGKKLIPFWRGKDPTLGVDLHKVFFEADRFDVVLWVHGSGAAEFLAQGEVSRRETWEQLERVFGGNFIGFAFYFN